MKEKSLKKLMVKPVKRGEINGAWWGKGPTLNFIRDRDEETKEKRMELAGGIICFKGDQKHMPWVKEKAIMLTAAKQHFHGIRPYLEPHK